MRFKIDENLPVEVADLLRANMHDAMTIFDKHMIGELDPKVASVCKSEERAIITLDLDFSDIRTYPPERISRNHHPSTSHPVKARCTCVCRQAHSVAQWQ